MRKMVSCFLLFLCFFQLLIALPTEEFMKRHSLQSINSVLNQYGMNQKDKELFISMIQAENDSFIGYHGGCSSYFLFQDIIKMVVEEKLHIPIIEDFHFLRIPGTVSLKYPSAKKFIDEFIANYPNFGDDRAETTIYILSLNIALYQSYAASYDLTPRYYLQNKPWTSPKFWTYLEEFFAKVGLDPMDVNKIVKQISPTIPQDRGFIMQFFDPSEDRSFLKTHFYAAQSGGYPISYDPLYLIHNPLINKQLRLVIDNKNILNPFGKLLVKRYHSMSEAQYAKYEKALRRLVKDLTFINDDNLAFYRDYLMELWGDH